MGIGAYSIGERIFENGRIQGRKDEILDLMRYELNLRSMYQFTPQSFRDDNYEKALFHANSIEDVLKMLTYDGDIKAIFGEDSSAISSYHKQKSELEKGLKGEDL